MGIGKSKSISGPIKEYIDYHIIDLSIIFDDNFNKIPDKILLIVISKLKIINFGNEYNQSIEWIPDNIEEIIFHAKSKFNKKIKKLPKKIKYLDFGSGSDFNSDILASVPIINNDTNNLENKYFHVFVNNNFSKSLNKLKLNITNIELDKDSIYNENLSKFKNLQEIKIGHGSLLDIKSAIPNVEIIILAKQKNIKNVSFKLSNSNMYKSSNEQSEQSEQLLDSIGQYGLNTEFNNLNPTNYIVQVNF